MADCYVYFIQAGTGYIKIGSTTDVKRRMCSLQTANAEQLNLLGVMKGSTAKEKSIHDRFKHLRVRGEWFRPGDDLLAFIRESKSPTSRKKSFSPVIHPMDNTVYFRIGDQVLWQGKPAYVVGLDFKSYDYEVGYDLLTEAGYVTYNHSYSEIQTIDGHDHDPEQIYKVNPADHDWRNLRELQMFGREGKTSYLLGEIALLPGCSSLYACLIQPPQVKEKLREIEAVQQQKLLDRNYEVYHNAKNH